MTAQTASWTPAADTQADECNEKCGDCDLRVECKLKQTVIMQKALSQLS
jgi:hypothetical protein